MTFRSFTTSQSHSMRKEELADRLELRMRSVWKFDQEHELIIFCRSIRQENCETPESSCRWSKSKRTNEIKLIDEFYEEFEQRKS